MATGKELPKSTKDSEETFDIHCSPCSDKGTIKEAKKLCVDCGSYLCDTCLQYHKQFPALKLHQIVDKSHPGSIHAVTGAQTDRCAVHPGRIIDKYCIDHGEICCEACITIKHRSCVNVDNLSNAANGIRDSQKHKDTKEGLYNVIKRISQNKEKFVNTIACLDQKKDSILKDIDAFQDKLINGIKELADVSRKEVVSNHAERVKTVQSDIRELETVLSVAEDSVMDVCASGLNDAQVLINCKNAKKVITDVGTVVEALSNNQDQSDFYYSFDKTLADNISGMKSLGILNDENDLPYFAKRYKSVNVNCSEVNAICVFENGTFAFVDCVSESITRLNSDYAIIDQLTLDGHPVSLCVTGPQEVALALRDEKKVQFILCDRILSVGNSFKIPQICTGLGYDSYSGHLYICSGAKWRWNESGRVDVYKKSGTLVKTYERDNIGIQIFSSPKHICIASNAIYVADSNNGLIALKKDGDKSWTFTDRKLKSAWGVCLLSETQLLVTGINSNNVLHITNDGKEICEFLGAGESLNKPFTVVFDRLNSRIMVGCRSGVITVYTLSRPPRTGHSNYTLLNIHSIIRSLNKI
ncbi:protein wech-like [Mercenaria mercenaria]|uniref:protein wech-like n=1 Tax=Mercenaria mercenaria TaxID=6596 RepID=UPI00234F699B|nr:protein wech-like [Mercenaria mercenaria]